MLKRGMPPSHPGKILKDMYMEPLNLTIGEASANLGITRKTLSMLLNERQGISAEMALRLSKALGTTPGLWMNMQSDFDLWNAAPRVALAKIKSFRPKKQPTETAAYKGNHTRSASKKV